MNMLEAIIARATPDWFADAACRTPHARMLVDAGRADFFPDRGRSAGRAREICAGCAVRDECAAAAEGNGRWLRGVWGGHTEGERRRARSAA